MPLLYQKFRITAIESKPFPHPFHIPAMLLLLILKFTQQEWLKKKKEKKHKGTERAWIPAKADRVLITWD